MIVLHTKDSSKVGNAILYGGMQGSPLPRFPNDEMPHIFFVETDFGHHMKLTWSEIEELYTVSHFQDYHQWRSERAKLHERTNHMEDLASGTMMTYSEFTKD